MNRPCEECGLTLCHPLCPLGINEPVPQCDPDFTEEYYDAGPIDETFPY